MKTDSDDTLDIILALAQDLREYADAALEAGCNIDETEALLAQVDELILT